MLAITAPQALDRPSRGSPAPQRADRSRRLLLATGRDEAPLPEIVQIESTNICNAKCVFCPRDDMERRQGIMDMALFTKIVDECAALGIEHVRMHNYGEPFVDRAARRQGALRQAAAASRRSA